MADNRRRRAGATATVGAGLTFGGGVLRHKGVHAANNGSIPPWKVRHPIRTSSTRALMRRGARGRVRYLVGAGMGLAGAPALAVGVHDYVHKADKRRDSFLHEGAAGTAHALHERAASAVDAPPKARVGPYAVGAGAGLAGSLAAHRALDRVKVFRGARHGTRAGVAATAGALAAGVSYPLARHLTPHGYEVTPTGVRRKRKMAKRPSSGQTVLDGRTMDPRQFRQGVVGKLYNPHALPPVTSKGRPRKVHWENPEGAGICGLDGAFGRGHGPFAHTYDEVTCVGCKRMLQMVHKADNDYLGRHTSRHAQTAAILGAGSTPFVGNVAAASAAARYAPPGQAHRAAARQYGGGAGGAAAGGVAGAYGLSHLAHRYGSVDRAANRTAAAATAARAKARNLRPVNATMARVDRAKARLPKGSGKMAARTGRAKEAAMATRLARPLTRNKVAAGVGFVAGKTVGGWVGGGTAMQRNYAAQDRYNLKHPAVKKNDPTGLSRKDQETILRRKRRGTHTQELTSGLGLAGAAMGATLLPGVRGRIKPKTAETIQRAAIGTGLASGGIAGVHGIRSARLQRKEIRAQEHAQGFAKAVLYPKENWIERAAHGGQKARIRRLPSGVLQANVDNPSRQMLRGERKLAVDETARVKTRRGVIVYLQNIGEMGVPRGERQGWADFDKADQRQPLTRMREHDAHALVRRYGDSGPLPKELSRQQRMDAYAARYVHAGGHKAEHWQRRADAADKVKTAGLAGATAGGAAMLALKSRRVAGFFGRRAARVGHAVDAATIGAATAGGAGELYAGHARRRRSSYSNSKAGVAASALRRMQDYSS